MLIPVRYFFRMSEVKWRAPFHSGAVLILFLGPLVANSQPSTWTLIQTRILDQNCVSCHSAGGFPPAVQTGLILTADSAYGKLANVVPHNFSARQDSLLRVSTQGGLIGLAKSFLWEKINAPNQHHFYSDHPGYGAIMPMGLPFLRNGEIEFVRQWILAGGPESGEVADTSALADTSRYQIPDFAPLPPPSEGFQLHLGPFNVPPNQVFDRELFYFEPLTHQTNLYVGRIEITMRPGSHHFLLYTFDPNTPPGLRPQANVYRDIRDSSGNLNFQVLAQMAYHRFFFGTQTPYINYSFPPGVALRLPARTGLDLNSHYVNRSTIPTTGEVYVNVHTVDSSTVQHRADILFLNNTNIVLPPHQITTITSTYTFPSSIFIVYMWSHAHEHMIDFSVERVGGATDGQVVYYTNDWRHPPVLHFNPQLRIGAGEGLRLITRYNNTTDSTIRWGLLSSDEMQILFGAYYHATTVDAGTDQPLPAKPSLAQNYPNPFNPSTTIRFSLSNRGVVSLIVYDLLGRKVASLTSGEMEAGEHEVTFDAPGLTSGVYFYRLQIGSFVATKKLLLLR